MKEGGTGTISDQPVQPQTMPDKYEVGSHNAIGLAGLSAGAAWILDRGVAELRRRERRLDRDRIIDQALAAKTLDEVSCKQ